MIRGIYSPIAAHSSGAPVAVAELTDYEEPRQVKIRLRADRVNYVPNGQFFTDTNSWTALDNHTLARTTGVGPLAQPAFGRFTTSGAASGPNGSAGARLSLAPNTTYTVSLYARLVSGQASGFVLDLVDATTLAATGTIVAQPTATLTSIDWSRLSATVTTSASGEVYLRLRTTVSAVYSVDVGAALAEVGASLGSYFDGSFGTNYLWEHDAFDNAMTAHAARSHYYQGFRAKKYRVDALIKNSIPLGANYRSYYASAPF